MAKIDLGKVIGDDFKYEDFTQEQLEELKVKGDAGDNKVIVSKDGVETREDLTLKKEGKFTTLLTGATKETHKLLVDDVLTEDGTPIIDVVNQLSNPNLLINGDFQVWQRGSSLNVYNGNAVAYGPDRWNNGLRNEKMERLINDSPAITKYKNRITKLSKEISRNGIVIQQYFEDFEQFKEKTLTVSFWIKTSKDCNVGVGVFGGTAETVSVKANSWIYVTKTFINVPCSENIFIISSLDLLEINDYLEIAGVKLELGNNTTPFVPRPYAEELAMCQRYCISGIRFANGLYMYNAYTYLLVAQFSEMRVAPSVQIESIRTYGDGGVNQTANKITGTSSTKLFFRTTATFPQMVTSVGGFSEMNIELDAEIY